MSQKKKKVVRWDQNPTCIISVLHLKALSILCPLTASHGSRVRDNSYYSSIQWKILFLSSKFFIAIEAWNFSTFKSLLKWWNKRLATSSMSWTIFENLKWSSWNVSYIKWNKYHVSYLCLLLLIYWISNFQSKRTMHRALRFHLVLHWSKAGKHYSQYKSNFVLMPSETWVR